jgi:hypothetical protein
MRRICGLALLIFGLLGTPRAGFAASPKAYLTWHAPHGSPRASNTIMAPCETGERKDTLFVCFTTGRSSPTLYGIEATILFHAPAGDTLGPSWWFGGGQSNPRNVWIEFPDSLQGAERPWHVPGYGAPKFDRAPQAGKLRLMYAVPMDAAGSVGDSTLYFFGRILIPRPQSGTRRCEQPIHIELASMTLFFEGKGTGTPAELAGRYVGWNTAKPQAAKAAGRRKVK